MLNLLNWQNCIVKGCEIKLNILFLCFRSSKNQIQNKFFDTSLNIYLWKSFDPKIPFIFSKPHHFNNIIIITLEEQFFNAKTQLWALLPWLMAIFIFLYLMKISMSKTHQILFPGRFVKWNVIKHHTVGKHWIFIWKSSVKY